jgi:threonine/homoserine efflux transporter RhtA
VNNTKLVVLVAAGVGFMLWLYGRKGRAQALDATGAVYYGGSGKCFRTYWLDGEEDAGGSDEVVDAKYCIERGIEL